MDFEERGLWWGWVSLDDMGDNNGTSGRMTQWGWRGPKGNVGGSVLENRVRIVGDHSGRAR
jgi:hypothetical protein